MLSGLSLIKANKNNLNIQKLASIAGWYNYVIKLYAIKLTKTN